VIRVFDLDQETRAFTGPAFFMRKMRQDGGESYVYHALAGKEQNQGMRKTCYARMI
jgi:hypothetical protein